MRKKRSGGSVGLSDGIRRAASRGDWMKVAELAKKAQRQDEMVVQMRKDGASMARIAEATGLSFGTVRSRVKEAGLPLDTRGAHATAVREAGDAAVAARADEVMAMFRDGLDVRAISSETGLPGAAIRRFLKRNAKPSDRASRRGGRPVAFDDEAIRSTLRLIAASIGKAPTGKDYDRTTDALRGAGLMVPSASTVRARFGSWTRALEAADLRPTRTQRGASRRGRRGRARTWGDGRVESVMRSWVEGNGRVPNSTEWARIARDSKGALPSCPVVMDRIGGGSWTAACEVMEGWL